MSVKTYYYARVSTYEQNLDRQLEAFKELGADERDIITDKSTGKDMNRENYQTLRNQLLRHGDTLVITSLDRLSRNKTHIKQELEFYRNSGVKLRVLDIPTTMTVTDETNAWVLDMVNNLLIEVMSSIAEHEREEIRKRQSEGITAAKKQGRHLGRPRAVCPDNWDKVYAVWKGQEISTTEAIKQLGLKKSTFYKFVNQN